MKRRTRLLRNAGLVIVAAAALAWPLVGATPAQAASVAVLSSSPADGENLVTSPTAITITFNQAVGSASSVVISCNGNAVPQPAARNTEDLQSLVVDLTGQPLPRGSCVVGWTVQGLADAGANSGTFSFTIQKDTVATAAPLETSAPGVTSPAAAEPESAPGEPPNVGGALGLGRLFSTLALAALFGSLVLITVAWPEGVEYILTIRFLRYAWLAALLASIVTIACMTAQATGKGFTASLSPSSWFELGKTTPGKAMLARVALVAACLWVVIRPERCIDQATQLPALALPGLAIATMGFSRAGGDLELLGYAAGMLHALAMAVWLGGLLLLSRVVLAGPGDADLVHAVRGFGRYVTPAWIITVATGLVQLYRLDAGHLLDMAHGRLLVLKVLVVAAMVFAGVATRQFVNARLTRADVLAAPLASRLRRAVGMEAVIGVMVLGVTAWMLASPPGNITSASSSTSDYAFQQRFVDATEQLDVMVYLNPARVGSNELLVQVKRPRTEISLITIRFDPPPNTLTDAVVLSVPLSVAGIGHLSQAIGIPFGVDGAWTITVDLVATAGTFHQTAVINVLAASGANNDVSVTPVTTPIVTSPPGVGVNVATTTSTPSPTSTTIASG